jgi:hypothetical protein
MIAEVVSTLAVAGTAVVLVLSTRQMNEARRRDDGLARALTEHRTALGDLRSALRGSQAVMKLANHERANSPDREDVEVAVSLAWLRARPSATESPEVRRIADWLVQTSKPGRVKPRTSLWIKAKTVPQVSKATPAVTHADLGRIARVQTDYTNLVEPRHSRTGTGRTPRKTAVRRESNRSVVPRPGRV